MLGVGHVKATNGLQASDLAQALGNWPMAGKETEFYIELMPSDR